jgi:hypothetical protein
MYLYGDYSGSWYVAGGYQTRSMDWLTNMSVYYHREPGYPADNLSVTRITGGSGILVKYFGNGTYTTVVNSSNTENYPTILMTNNTMQQLTVTN